MFKKILSTSIIYTFVPQLPKIVGFFILPYLTPFIHSYYVKPSDDACILTQTNYDGIEFCSSILKNNIFATQFHPEKSADKGISIYKNWALVNNLL